MHRHYRIHLVNSQEPTWELPYLVGSTVLADLDGEPLLAAVRAVAGAYPVAGVLSWDESKIIQTARVAADLGLPGGFPDTMLRCRDKHLTRQALEAAGVPQPVSILVGDVDAALVAAEKIGYPVVLKPRAASASYGVVLVADAGQLADRFTFARETTVPHMPRYEMEVLVEEYLAGPEISVDAAVSRGRVRPLFLARKEIGFPPFFEETGHYVSNIDPLLSDPDLVRALDAMHAALGFTDGWTHSEFKLTPSGPKVIEINGRLGGDLIPYVGMRASGIDPGLVASAVACGLEPDTDAGRRLVGGVRFFYCERPDTVIESVEFATDELPAAIDLAVPLAERGTRMSPPPEGIVSGRLAFATVVAETQDACRQALDQAQAALRVRTADDRDSR